MSFFDLSGWVDMTLGLIALVIVFHLTYAYCQAARNKYAARKGYINRIIVRRQEYAFFTAVSMFVAYKLDYNITLVVLIALLIILLMMNKVK